MLQSSGTASGQPEVAGLGPWFHNLHLPDGTQTAPDHPLGDFPRFKWEQLAPHLPTDLTGTEVLDIGCNAGFYSFELARRGARVLGIDHDERYLRQARWANDKFGLGERVSFQLGNVYDLASWERRFDLVVFMGVFYHLRHPLLALDVVSAHLDGMLVFQTMTIPGSPPRPVPDDLDLDERGLLARPGSPAMAFLEHRLADDATNWWLANDAAVEAMLRSTGLAIEARPGHELWICRRERPFAHGAELAAATGSRPASSRYTRGG